MQANIENLKAELATGLVPKLASATSAVNDFFSAMSEDNLKKHHVGFLSKGLLEIVGLKKSKGKTSEFRPFDQVAAALNAALKMPEQTKKAGGPTKADLSARRSRLRQAAEAARQAVQDRAAFNVEKTGATKTLKDDLAALRKYNALLTRRIKGGHGTLELEREQFHVQMQIADVLRQQADLAKKTGGPERGWAST